MAWEQQTITTVTAGSQLYKALLSIGLQPTDSCIVHTRMSAFGFIPGGEQTVVSVLKKVLADGDIIMPAQSTDLSDPEGWEFPPVDPSLISSVHDALPAFDPDLTPVHGLGRIPEYFRALHNTRRSLHPLYSMAAWGKHADWICETRTYDMPFGEGSPLDKLYQLDGKVLFLGTGFDTCTAIHYAESTIGRPLIREAAPVGKTDPDQREASAEWITYGNVDLDKYDDFTVFGHHFMDTDPSAIRSIELNGARILTFPIRTLVSRAREYYRNKDREMQNL
ncbi:MAG: aminoglycoside N(3)-acetyltransferase [Scardovia wiggsiae]|uniref:aminoglycoside N(3)-acetyltransferase n=1 Tax=Scardovia wiggsiae TaxID=230143 RepID=UPI003616F853